VSDRPSSLGSVTKPLPPITPVDKPNLSDGDDVPESVSAATPSEAWNEKKTDTFEGDAFFMTQVNEAHPDGETETKPEPETKESSPVPRPPSEKKKKHRKHRERVPSRYKGYEVLLDAEEDPDVVLPTDMQGNVRALQYTLNHPLVFRDPKKQLDKPQPSFVPYQKVSKVFLDVVLRSRYDLMVASTLQDILHLILNMGVVILRSKTRNLYFPSSPIFTKCGL
jgi:hypothetical protein